MAEQGNEAAPSGDQDGERERIVGEEEKVLARVQKHLQNREMRRPTQPLIDYDKELLVLRDAINEARLEDIPPLLEEMERLQGVAARRAEVTESHIDPKSPYFGRLVLREGQQKREILIGRGTYLDSRTGVRIVDWRDAPVSRLYYRYEEGD
ncbi:MAG TPA: DNA helicase UvrD, partial [Polyangiales bacterium]|nr:DNA helicase UvrD [Polyangiales bacterium]